MDGQRRALERSERENICAVHCTINCFHISFRHYYWSMWLDTGRLSSPGIEFAEANSLRATYLLLIFNASLAGLVAMW